MALTKRGRNEGSKSTSGSASRRLVQMAVGLGVLVFLAVGLMVFTQTRAKAAREERIRVEAESERMGREAQERHREYQAEVANRPKAEPALKQESKKFTIADAGIFSGLKTGELIGKSGNPYPSTGEIDQLAKTTAVDAGTTPDDVEFTTAFKEAFPTGYADGRRSRKSR